MHIYIYIITKQKVIVIIKIIGKPKKEKHIKLMAGGKGMEKKTSYDKIAFMY